MVIEAEKLLMFSKRMIALAAKNQIELRLIGGLAVFQNCRPELRDLTPRESYHDIDFFGKIEQTIKVEKFFKKINFEKIGTPNECSRVVFHIYTGNIPGIDRIIQIEVYFGEIIFNHHIPKPYFSKEFP